MAIASGSLRIFLENLGYELLRFILLILFDENLNNALLVCVLFLRLALDPFLIVRHRGVQVARPEKEIADHDLRLREVSRVRTEFLKDRLHLRLSFEGIVMCG